MINAKAKAGFIVGLVALVVGAMFVVSDQAKSGVGYVGTCDNLDAATWEFGIGGDGCDAHRFGNVQRLKYVYSDFVFDRAKNDDVEQRRAYVTNVNALLRDLATEYIRSRRPDVQDDEVAAFVEGIRTVAQQETYWSHYRRGADGRLKLATGDQVRSHGMMQINQRYHASATQDNSFDIVGNVIFGIEHYYTEWEVARQARWAQSMAKRQKREQFLVGITRGAYSTYNGGPSAGGRFLNPGHTWAINDKNFYKKLRDRDWNEFIVDKDHKLRVDLECMRSGDERCAVAQEHMGEYLKNRTLVMEDGSTCVMTDGETLHCARDARVFMCLEGLSPEALKSTPVKVKATDTDILEKPKKFYENRVALCQQSFPAMGSIGDTVTTLRATNVRAEIGGKTVGFTKRGQSFQILDIESHDGARNERFYRIRLDNKIEGWIAGGNLATADKTVAIERLDFVLPKNTKSWLPTKGTQVEIAKLDGLKMLSAPEEEKGEVLSSLAKGTAVEVEDVVVTGAANEMWLKVKSGSESGFIYAGRTYPKMTIEQWVKVK